MDRNISWPRQPGASRWIDDIIEQLTLLYEPIGRWRDRLRKETSCDFLHFLDHLALCEAPQAKLHALGFIFDEASRSFYHPKAQLPRLCSVDHVQEQGLFLRVDNLETCLQTHRLPLHIIEGSPYSPYRRAPLIQGERSSLWVIERRSWAFEKPVVEKEEMIEPMTHAAFQWRGRPRSVIGMPEEVGAFEYAQQVACQMVKSLGRERAATLILELEREYWQQRCLAGSVQKLRQDRLGLGWGNHDHHTFRCSRVHFARAVALFEVLGFSCRERFYAGAQAGWGAQVMENTLSGHVLFLDVDLSKDELEGDFAHVGLQDLGQSLGTVGLWCALHGDSLLQAGMHHLEGQFLFDHLCEDLAGWGLQFMKPFSDMSYLHQAFSSPEFWHVDPRRLEILTKSGQITSEQARQFAMEGAIGSHLENLERDEGYKGFNQKNVSSIIRATDPRSIEESPMA